MRIAKLDRVAVALVLTLICGEAKADGACDFTNPSAFTERLYQLHGDGSIFLKNDKACTEPACFGGWFQLDNNKSTVAIASYCDLYQMHDDGAIFQYTGKGTAQDQCPIGGFCGDWKQLDQNQQTTAIAVGAPYFNPSLPPVLYQLHNDGAIFRKNDKPCNEAACFGGWDTLDLNKSTVAIAAGFNGLYQLHNDGTIFRWDGKTACDNAGNCVGWALLDQNPNNAAIAAGHGFYRMHKDGTIFRYVGQGESCTTTPCPNWQQESGPDPTTIAIKASFPTLYRLRKDGKILRRNNNPCNGPACTNGWDLLDQHPTTVAITAGRLLYQMRNDGSIFRFNGSPCGATPGCAEAWDQLDANPGTKGIVVNGSLFSR